MSKYKLTEDLGMGDLAVLLTTLDAFGKEYEVDGPELNCDSCGSYGQCLCENNSKESS